MIVADVNVFLHSVVESEHGDAARRVFDADPDWIAPALLRVEFLNVLATWNRRGIMSAINCQKTWHQAVKLIPDNLVEPDLNLALNLSLNHQITAYDAQYVHVAIDHNLPLVTEDRELLRKFPQTAISMADFLKFSGG